MRWRLMLGCCLAVMGLAACGASDEEKNPGQGQGRLTLRDGQLLDQAPECSLHNPHCSSGLSCLSFKVEGVSHVRCMDHTVVCEQVLSCTGGTECAILESLPAQVKCTGTCTGPDCDTAVSDSP